MGRGRKMREERRRAGSRTLGLLSGARALAAIPFSSLLGTRRIPWHSGRKRGVAGSAERAELGAIARPLIALLEHEEVVHPCERPLRSRALLCHGPFTRARTLHLSAPS